MFRHLNNIDSAFKHVRLFTFIVIAASTTLCGYCIYFCISQVSSASERIYLISNGQAMSAISSTRTENIPVEAKDHVRVFHQCFFSLSPDEKAIEATMAKALYLADRSAKEGYDDLREKGFYTSIITGNVSQEVKCDSVLLQTDTYPYYFRYFGKQIIIRSSTIVTRRLITEGYLRSIDRTDHNPHGFIIEKWATLFNDDISHEKR